MTAARTSSGAADGPLASGGDSATRPTGLGAASGVRWNTTEPGLMLRLASHSDRLRCTAAASDLARLSGGRVIIEDPAVGGLRLIIEASHDGSTRLTTELGARTPLRRLPPPALSLLQPDDDSLVATRAERDIEVEYACDSLVPPRITGMPGQDQPWGYLARTIALDATGHDPIGDRFVEPGVGRSYLLDYLRFEGRPEFLDFSATGVGRTPYSAGGLVVGLNRDDGYMPLVRARHRHRLSLLIEQGGGRVPRTAAIVRLRSHYRREPNGAETPVALFIRGFRSVLRVKQLDPIGSLMLSRRHWNAVQRQLRSASAQAAPALMPGPCRCLTPTFLYTRCSQRRTCNVLRRLHIATAAPAIFWAACDRLAFELWGEAIADAIPAAEFAFWFSRTLGEQVGVLANLRMLHEYRAALPAKADMAEGPNSLSDTNVTLAAELPDLDTAILVDDDDAYNYEVFGLGRAQQQELRNRFWVLHAREVALARDIARTLTIMAVPGAPAAAAEHSPRAFDQGYRMAAGRLAP
ncbi:MAG: hypothetical protein ACLQDY_16905 [Streptosporangiaceae bacterium]